MGVGDGEQELGGGGGAWNLTSKFLHKFFYVISKTLSGEVSCACTGLFMKNYNNHPIIFISVAFLFDLEMRQF